MGRRRGRKKTRKVKIERKKKEKAEVERLKAERKKKQ